MFYVRYFDMVIKRDFSARRNLKEPKFINNVCPNFKCAVKSKNELNVYGKLNVCVPFVSSSQTVSQNFMKKESRKEIF